MRKQCCKNTYIKLNNKYDNALTFFICKTCDKVHLLTPAAIKKFKETILITEKKVEKTKIQKTKKLKELNISHTEYRKQRRDRMKNMKSIEGIRFAKEGK